MFIKFLCKWFGLVEVHKVYGCIDKEIDFWQNMANRNIELRKSVLYSKERQIMSTQYISRCESKVMALKDVRREIEDIIY